MGDAPGRYVISQDPTYVSASSVVPQYDDEIEEELHAGEHVVVLEVRRMEGRLRARIKDPPGWISIVNLETGIRFATRARAALTSGKGFPEGDILLFFIH